MAAFDTWSWQISTLPAAMDEVVQKWSSPGITTLLYSFCVATLMDYDICRGNFDTLNIDFSIVHRLK